MTEISGAITILLIGWVLGIFTSVIQPLIITPIKRWQDKRNFKKILRADIRIKMANLRSIEGSITEFFNCKTLDEVLIGNLITNKPTDLPVINNKISNDFFNANYVKFLDYFNEKTDLLNLYQRFSTLNMLVDIMEKYLGSEHYRFFLIHYCGHLKTALQEGTKLSLP